MKNSFKHAVLSLASLPVVKPHDVTSRMLIDLNQNLDAESARRVIETFFGNTPYDALVHAAGFNPRQTFSGKKRLIQHTPSFHSPKEIFFSRLLLRCSAVNQVSLDLMRFNKGGAIPPHAHVGVASGFYVLQGAVRIQHYHVDEYKNDGVHAHRTIDRRLDAGMFTTNSDEKDNIHWLESVEDDTVLFRVNKLGIPSRLENMLTAGRLYVDPTAVSDTTGMIPFVSMQDARTLRMAPANLS
ncbi:hypothetical protein [Alteromonas sp. CYL-A6]|uniref:hypothetical protein n=1 Tax=Alteromonas nitratireducens TaxID=3390813 RepID=UPI0034AEEDA4